MNTNNFYDMKFTLLLPLFVFLVSCSNPDKRRANEAAEQSVVQPSQRPINAGDVIVPGGYRIEAVQSGLSFPVDVTFDDQGNTYIAETGGHTYGTKPARAPEARILKVLPDNSVEILYDNVWVFTQKF